MRALLLLTGAPGSGKSTLIENWGLKDYTISPDELRLLMQAPQWDITGKKIISQKNDKKVWSLLFQILEERMQRGEFTVIDATHSKRSDFNRYKKLIKNYRYRVYTISLRDVPIEECKRRNLERKELKQVPEEVIDRMYARFNSDIGDIPNWVTVIKTKEELDNILKWKEIDFSKYENIIHIGDIHGSYDVLVKALGYNVDMFKDKPKTAFVFVGDYLDRGTNNAAVLDLLLNIYELPNVYMLEGNHEIWLWYYANNEISKIRSKEFLKHTMPELDKYGVDKKAIRRFYRSLYQVLKYKYYDKNVLVCHAGIPIYNIGVDNTSTEELVRGVGRYEDIEYISAAFLENNRDTNNYLIHGHRNVGNLPIRVNERVFNLDGRVEAGGYLRLVKLNKDGFKPLEFKNDVFRKEFVAQKITVDNIDTVEKLIFVLRNDKDVNEKKFGNISSFNFNRDVFRKKKWNARTIKARGLFINTNMNKIVARSYDKFFNLNERDETKLDALVNYKYPAKVFIKYNGFLGLCGYNEEKDELLFTSKSVIDGNFVSWFKDIFYQTIYGDRLIELKQYLKNKNKCMIFEVVDQENDPHIIEYDKKKFIVLLDVVDRDVGFKKLDYEELKEVADRFGLMHKELGGIFKSYKDLYNWIKKINDDTTTTNVEGYVVEFADDNKIKIKTNYYKFWKMMRGILYKMRSKSKGQNISQASLYNPLSIEFWQFLKNNIDNLDGKNIIDLRKEFYAIDENKDLTI